MIAACLSCGTLIVVILLLIHVLRSGFNIYDNDLPIFLAKGKAFFQLERYLSSPPHFFPKEPPFESWAFGTQNKKEREKLEKLKKSIKNIITEFSTINPGAKINLIPQKLSQTLSEATLMVWVKLLSDPTERSEPILIGTSWKEGVLLTFYSPQQGIRLFYGYGLGSQISSKYWSNALLDQWYFLSLTVSEAYIQLFIDGFPASPQIPSKHKKFMIKGKFGVFSEPGAAAFAVADPIIFPRALKTFQIKEHYSKLLRLSVEKKTLMFLPLKELPSQPFGYWRFNATKHQANDHSGNGFDAEVSPRILIGSQSHLHSKGVVVCDGKNK